MPRQKPSLEERCFHEAIGRRIAAARLQMRLSQKELSELVGKDRTIITRVESGSCRPSPFLLDQIARALKVHITHLLEGEFDATLLDDWVNRVENRR